MNIKRLSALLSLCLLLCCGCAAPASPGHAEEAPGT